jgi:hypothetical protein
MTDTGGDLPRLPKDMLHNIFGRLSKDDRDACALVSPAFRDARNSPSAMWVRTREQAQTFQILHPAGAITH